ncbi:MAG: hypothetical protein ABSG37_11985 [Candidatus Limnocylindrales bacterium]|jgi:hypothetical protein
MNDVALDRPLLSELLTQAMMGHGAKDAVPFALRGGGVKTFALEVNSPKGGLQQTAEWIAGSAQLATAATHDSSLVLLWGAEGGLIVDGLDARFWLVHTTAPMAWVRATLGRIVWQSPWVDWCWLTGDMLHALRSRGDERWFKADFKGADLLPSDGVRGRRLKVQLEGDEPQLLQQVLRNAGYSSSTALTGLALTLVDERLGKVEEAAHYRGSFSSRGDSFDLHLSFVSAALGDYAKAVRAVEQTYGIAWEVTEGRGMDLTGGVIEIQFERPIANMEQFLSGLFSCRDPFRLWAVPRPVTEDFVEAEAVDLHIGQRFRMDITRRGLRVYLGRENCGNTLFRLLANLQHRYDATASARLA